MLHTLETVADDPTIEAARVLALLASEGGLLMDDGAAGAAEVMRERE
jgi:hypothetical protein